MLLPQSIKRRVLEKMIFACQAILVNDPELSVESRHKIQEKIDKEVDKMKLKLKELNQPKNGNTKNSSSRKLSIDKSNIKTTI
jgi:hypothetical protein